MGSELLFDPWQPHSMLLPFLFLVVLVWSLACGDIWMLPFAVGVASLVLETHLSYAVLVPIVAVWGVGALAWNYWQRRRLILTAWQEVRRGLRRPVLVAAAVGVVALGATVDRASAARKRRQPRPPVQHRRFVRRQGRLLTRFRGLVVSVVSTPPLWLRPSFGQAFLPNATTGPVPGVPAASIDVPSVAVAVLSLAVVLGRSPFCPVGDAQRQRPTAMAAATGIVLVLGAVCAAGALPGSTFGLAPHHFRWLWPVAVFVTFALVSTAAEWPRRRRTGVRAVAVALARGPPSSES